MLRVISIVFLFLVQLRFPSNLSTIQVIRKRYGNDTVKLVRQFEKLNYKHLKILLDLNFLENCIKNFIQNQEIDPMNSSNVEINLHPKGIQTRN